MNTYKEKKLSNNILLFSISSFGTKFLSFFLVPFYTNYLSTSEYGTIDLIVNTASLLVPIFTLNIYESVMRYTLADKDNSEYLRIGCYISEVGSIILAGLLFAIYWSLPALLNISNLIWIWLLFTCTSIYNLLTSYLRATDRVPVMVQASIINSGLLITMNILFIAHLKIGVSGYFISTILGLTVSSLYMVLRGQLRRKQKVIEYTLLTTTSRDMLKYSIPLIFTAIAWWINSSLDRYFVTGFCGTNANGIYSIAYKIPNLLIAFQTVFAQAWAISAVMEFDKNDSDGFMGHTYVVFEMVMLLSCMGIMLLNIALSKILYANEFFVAWHYVPYLLISTLFGALASYFGGIFSAVKNSKICALSTVISAIINTILNAILIPMYGISGAAIATLIAYFFSWLVRLVVSLKYIRMKVNYIRSISAYCLLFIQLICAVGEKHFYIVQVGVIIIVILMYKELWLEVLQTITKKANKRSKR